MRALVLLALALLAACGGIDQRGVLLMLEEGYEAEILLSSADGIASPDGLHWSDGRLYIADEGGSAVRVWSPDGGLETLATAGSGIISPEDLVRDRAGRIWFTDDSAGGLWRIDSGREAVRAARLGATEGIALLPSGELAVGDADRSRVLLFAPDGRARVLVGPEAGIAKPESIAADDRGNLYIADNRDHILYLLAPNGRLHRPVQGRRDFSPESILWAGGAVIISDSRNGRLHRFTPEDGLATIAAFGGELANVQGLAADESGNLYVSIQSDLPGRRGFILRLRLRS